MHNQRIGRDDLLKIEVSQLDPFVFDRNSLTTRHSGLVHHHQQAGASTQVAHRVTNAADVMDVASAPHVVAQQLLPVVSVVDTTTTAEIVQTATETTTVAIAGTGIVLAAQMTVIGTAT